jgi:CRISPR type III-B/RAMP module RAMP protein Cmr6
MEKKYWREKRFEKHEVIEHINEAEHICVPCMPIFHRDRLSSWLEEIIDRSPFHQEMNLSLLLNKFPYWFVNEGDEYSLTPEFRKRGTKKTTHDYGKELLMAIARLSKALPRGYDSLFLRHYASPGGKALCHTDLTTRTRLLIGHSGSASVLEVGVTLHPYYGVPVIPGSAVKGVTRHFCEETKPDKKNEWEEIFGSESASKPTHEGAVVFYDAWPVSWDRGKGILELDNITTHYPGYYRKYQKQKPSETDTVNPPQRAGAEEQAPGYPADNQNPIPVFFLAVRRGVTFRFAVRPSASTDKPELAQCALRLIKDALSTFGIGAKTGSSYGYFRSKGGCSKM